MASKQSATIDPVLSRSYPSQAKADESKSGIATLAESERREGTGPDRRNDRVDRRVGLDRRRKSAEATGYTGAERRTGEDRCASLERRRGPGRRLSDDRKSAEEGEMTEYQFEFVQAIQTYKKVNKRLYPTFTEILEIVYQLGYRKVLKRSVRIDAPEPALTDLSELSD